MKTASITHSKNHLSALLDEVKGGETIIITERKRPVARLEPISLKDMSSEDRLADLERRGLIRRPKKKFDVKAFLAMPPIKLKSGTSIVKALLEEREEGR